MEGNIDVLRKCPEGKIGMMTRFCNKTSETTAQWENVIDSYCLDLTPALGMAYVDFVYNVSESRARFIGYRPIGFAEGIHFVYGVPTNAVSVHRIAEEADMVFIFIIYYIQHSSVQIRVTLPSDKAVAFYNTIMSSDKAEELGAYFSANINVGKRYQYLTFKGEQHCDITYIGDRVLTNNPMPKPNAFIEYIKANLLWISICVLELIIIIIIAVMRKQVKKDCVEKSPFV